MTTAVVTTGYRTSVQTKGMAKKELPDVLRAYICDIVETWAKDGESNTQIAESLGVEKQTVGKIRSDGSAGLRVRDGVAKRLQVSIPELMQRAEQWSSSIDTESQLPPPATGGLMAHREYPALRRRLLEYYSPRVVSRVDRADFGQMPERLDWLFVKDIAEAVQRRLMREAEENSDKQ